METRNKPMDYTTLPTTDVLQKTMDALKSRGINPELVQTKEEALARLQILIPDGVTLMTGASVTLQQIDFEALLISGKHPWKNLKDQILAEKDPQMQRTLRKQGILADYFLGSVNALAQTGELVNASATGSQLPAYAYSSDHVIWVAGAQKIVPTLEDAIRRVRDYVVPLEDKHMKSMGAPGTTLGKILIFERESPFLKRSLTLLLVNEVLGF
jgi:hypothetical protein